MTDSGATYPGVAARTVSLIGLVVVATANVVTTSLGWSASGRLSVAVALMAVWLGVFFYVRKRERVWHEERDADV